MMQDTDTEALRPALTAKDSLAEIEATLQERESCYRQAMDFFVDTDERQINEICDAIVRRLGEQETDRNEAHS
jgi:shikimate kinase